LLARAWRFSTSWCRQGPRVLPRLPPGMMQPDGGQESADFLERVYEMMKARGPAAALPPARVPHRAVSPFAGGRRTLGRSRRLRASTRTRRASSRRRSSRR
jgi:hypothetical protein